MVLKLVGANHQSLTLYLATDLTISYKVAEGYVKAVRCTLDMFYSQSGQTTNEEKSIVHFSRNVQVDLKEHLRNILKMGECDHTGSYLGIPFSKKKSKKRVFASIIEKIKSKLSDWKQRALSQASRMILIKLVVKAFPQHLMQCFLLPISMC